MFPTKTRNIQFLVVTWTIATLIVVSWCVIKIMEIIGQMVNTYCGL